MRTILQVNRDLIIIHQKFLKFSIKEQYKLKTNVMETQIKKTEKNDRKKIFQSVALFFSFLVLFTINVMSASNTKNPQPVNKDDENAAVAAIQKSAEHEELMTYIYMTVGFIIILGTAWFAVAGKKKKNRHEIIEKHAVVKHHPGIHDKRYGTKRS